MRWLRVCFCFRRGGGGTATAAVPLQCCRLLLLLRPELLEGLLLRDCCAGKASRATKNNPAEFFSTSPSSRPASTECKHNSERLRLLYSFSSCCENAKHPQVCICNVHAFTFAIGVDCALLLAGSRLRSDSDTMSWVQVMRDVVELVGAINGSSSHAKPRPLMGKPLNWEN